jgi:hypothetical protein
MSDTTMLPNYDSENGIGRNDDGTFVMSRHRWGFARSATVFKYKGVWYSMVNSQWERTMGDYYKVTLAPIFNQN